MTKPNIQTLKGFRDFLPQEKRRRDFVAKKIKKTFELSGFEPLETPTLEYADLLLGKYGDEADKLVYTFEDRGERKVGLRYDQTVPTARVLAQYQNELPKFFRRYQMQNVFRADKPQKGRFREFAQCDIDIFGTRSEIADAEILATTYSAYKSIGFTDIKILVNSREVLLETLSPFANEKVDVNSIIQTIDKLDKQSEEKVISELRDKGVVNAENALKSIKEAKPDKNLQIIFSLLEGYDIPEEVIEFNPRIARGLDYYTGMIFEVLIPGYGVGSVGGGGRYDNLIKDLSGLDTPAVGMAFGFDRTVEAALALGLIDESEPTSKVLVTFFDENYLKLCINVLNTLRAKGVPSEMYPEVDKIGKQIKYADKNRIPFVVVLGEEEDRQNKVTLKEMASGESKLMSLEELVDEIKRNL
jgi:histidyl-tRNA synthetase